MCSGSSTSAIKASVNAPSNQQHHPSYDNATCAGSDISTACHPPSLYEESLTSTLTSMVGRDQEAAPKPDGRIQSNMICILLASTPSMPPRWPLSQVKLYYRAYRIMYGTMLTILLIWLCIVFHANKVIHRDDEKGVTYSNTSSGIWTSCSCDLSLSTSCSPVTIVCLTTNTKTVNVLGFITSNIGYSLDSDCSKKQY